MKVLLDTHIWLWYLQGNENLSPSIKQLLDTATNEAWISPISIWETTVLAEKGKLSVSPDISTFIRKALELFPVKEARLSIAIVMKSRTLEFHHQDPADRFIAATAAVYKMPLATVDKRLIELPWLETIA
jgi:PIN domain nuclease of toxin-antitoxin system